MRISDWSSDVCSSDLQRAGEMTNRPGRLMVSPDPRRARTEARGANRTRWRCFVNLLVADWVFPPLFPKASPMPRHTPLGPDSFDSERGYCAVVGTRELLWCGLLLTEPATGRKRPRLN